MNTVSDAEIRELFTAQNKKHEEMTAAIAGYNLNGYPTAMVHIMQHDDLNRLAARNGMESPDYKKDPVEVFRRSAMEIGCNTCDQWIPYNSLTMGDKGYENGGYSATTGVKEVVLDGMPIEEPEDVVEHLERFVFPKLQERIDTFDEEARIREIGLEEYRQQMELGTDILKTGYRFIKFPHMRYETYGYENYFCAYQLYEDVMERDFKLQAEFYRKNNKAAAEAYKRYNLPKLFRLDHDLTDSRSTLVDIRSMDRIYFPYVDECLQPILKDTDVRLIWHCDGNITPMVPRLLDIGIRGFQGFQYEDGVDFEKLCKMRDKDGKPLFMWAGVSVTTTLPHGTPEDVRKQLDYLVEVHGDTALMLGCTSSVVPGIPSANIDALMEGLRDYRTHKK